MLKNTLLNSGSSILYFFLQWLTTVLSVRFASFETAGVFALAISFTNIFYFLALFGIRNFQVSDVTNTYSNGQYAAARLVAAFIALVGFLSAAFLTDLSPYVFGCYFIYMIFKLFEAYTEGYFAVLQKHNRYGMLAVSYSLKGIVSTVAFALVLWFTHDLLGAIVVMTVGYFAVILVVDLPMIIRMGPCKIQLRGCAKILYHCIPLLLISLSVPIMNYITRYAIGLKLSEYDVGQYSSLSSVIVVMSTLAGAIFVVFIPEISLWRNQGKWGRIRRLILWVLLFMALAGVAAVIVGKLLGAFVCVLIFGEEILDNIDLLIPLLITATLLMIKSFFSALLVSIQQRKQLLIGECCGTVACVLTAIPLTSIYGMHGANFSYALGVILQILTLGAFTLIFIRQSEKGKEHHEENVA